MGSSQSALTFYNQQDRAAALCSAGAADSSKSRAQIFYHSALATTVATWDAYIHAVVREFFVLTTRATLPDYNLVHQLLRDRADFALDRFNTPNWDNTRNMLLTLTGYDPIGDWHWPARSMGGQQVRQRLNEVLTVRHSFAHGFTLPAYPWLADATGKTRLTKQVILETGKLMLHLVKATDRGLCQHILRVYGPPSPW